jgi:pilus assembly protein Flp/PilA
MLSYIKTLANDQNGATAIEYGLIAGLIAVVIIAALTTLGNDVSGVFNTIATSVQGAIPAS